MTKNYYVKLEVGQNQSQSKFKLQSQSYKAKQKPASLNPMVKLFQAIF